MSDDQNRLRRRAYEAGSIVFAQGDAADEAYIIEKGRVDVMVQGKDGSLKVVGSMGPGELVGELALIDNKPRSATGRAVEASTLVIIPRQHFENQVESLSPAIRRVFTIVSGRVRTLSSELAKVRSEPG